MIRISAGTRSPPLTSTMSPTTSSSARISLRTPSRVTNANCGTMFLNDSIIFDDFASWKYWKQPVMITTPASTMPRYNYKCECYNWHIFIYDHTLSFDGYSAEMTSTVYAMKHRIAPIHSNIAKPPNKLRQNLTHSGVFFGGVNIFGPSRSNTSCIFLCVKPCSKWVPKRATSWSIGIVCSSCRLIYVCIETQQL
jgi:hypothetical protein